jgi:hypothetical protein
MTIKIVKAMMHTMVRKNKTAIQFHACILGYPPKSYFTDRQLLFGMRYE